MAKAETVMDENEIRDTEVDESKAEEEEEEEQQEEQEQEERKKITIMMKITKCYREVLPMH